jgi:phosphoglycolate phosphatase
VCGGEGPALKPNPAPILLALAPTHVAPKDAWVVGDGVQDIDAARAAGAMSVAVLGGFTPEETLRTSHPDAVIATLAELLPLIARSHPASPHSGPLPPFSRTRERGRG